MIIAIAITIAKTNHNLKTFKPFYKNPFITQFKPFYKTYWKPYKYKLVKIKNFFIFFLNLLKMVLNWYKCYWLLVSICYSSLKQLKDISLNYIAVFF